ncbi:MAG: hypothetical protein ACK4IT_02550 [Thioalkalivibrionaceae bacterium]
MSDEAIHALVDGEFSPADRLDALETIAADPALGQEVCEVHRLKALVRTAYADVKPPVDDAAVSACDVLRAASANRGARSSRATMRQTTRDGAPETRPGARMRPWPTRLGSACLRYATAAALTGAVTAMIATAVIGSAIDTHNTAVATSANGQLKATEHSSALDSAASDPWAVDQTTARFSVAQVPTAQAFDAPITAETQQILLHLTESDPAVMADLLADLERLLREGARHQRDLRVQVVTNAGGLNLLRADRSPFSERIASLQRAFPQIRFAACESTLEDHQRAEGVRPVLLPGVITIDSGVAEVARRQREGWVYIRV